MRAECLIQEGESDHSLHEPRERRHQARRHLLFRTDGEAPLDPAAEIVIKDLSSSGFRLEAPDHLSPGDPISVFLPRCGPVEATVVWVKDNQAGCRFVSPLSGAAISAVQLASQPKLSRLPIVAEWSPMVSELSGTLPDEVRWPRPVRIAVLAGISIALWSLIATWII